MGVGAFGDRALKSLSEGQQQRVQLAACFVNRPVLAVLDEPFALLDFEGSAVLREVLAELADDGCAVLVSSHQLEVMEDVCDDVTVLQEGRPVEHGVLDDIRARAGATVVVRFAGALAEDWTPGLDGVTEISPREVGRGQVVVTLGFVSAADRDAVVAVAAATGDLVQMWWGPRRLRDLYRAVVTAP